MGDTASTRDSGAGEVLLFVVDAAFEISGRGCVLAPGIPIGAGRPDVRIGTPLTLRRPDGSALDATLRGVELLNHGTRPPPQPRTAPILVDRPVTKHDVPAGTRVMLASIATRSHPGRGPNASHRDSAGR
jgi:hypothetical protein